MSSYLLKKITDYLRKTLSLSHTHTHTRTHIYIYIYIYIGSAFNKFPDFFVQALKIIVDS